MKRTVIEKLIKRLRDEVKTESAYSLADQLNKIEPGTSYDTFDTSFRSYRHCEKSLTDTF